MQIAFTTTLPIEGFRHLISHQFLTMNDDLSQAEVLVSSFDFPVNASILDRMPKLRLVANYAVGYNNIDLEACRQRHILVTNTPDPVIEPTAELAFSLMLAVARRTAELDRRLRNHTCEPFGLMSNLGHTLHGKTLGIIGLGNIGCAIARRADAFGMSIIYHNRHPRTDYPSARYVEFDELLQNADFVSLNLPYTPEVHHLIGERELTLMKSTAYLINTARGAHVDEQALIHALQFHQIAGAALDVYEHEPKISPELLQLDNVVLSPHIGTATLEDRIAMGECVTDNILAFINGQLDKMNLVL